MDNRINEIASLKAINNVVKNNQVISSNDDIIINNQIIITSGKDENIYSVNFSYFNTILITLNSSIGFFFFGYNICVFNVMQENMSSILNWGPQKNLFISVITAILPLGAAMGSFCSGKIA